MPVLLFWYGLLAAVAVFARERAVLAADFDVERFFAGVVLVLRVVLDVFDVFFFFPNIIFLLRVDFLLLA